MHAAGSHRLLCQRCVAADLSDRFGRELDVDRFSESEESTVVLQEIGDRSDWNLRSVALIDRVDELIGEQRVADVRQMESVEAEESPGDEVAGEAERSYELAAVLYPIEQPRDIRDRNVP